MPGSSKSKDESAGNPGDDDAQLTIKIPNPKVYMARQSLWVGHRGKPRCDHCRLNNLKCDRVLPTCNHCSWAAGRVCKYTPLPTPAHRGIPRCDSCRVQNLKCDRSLPICNHCKEDNKGDCVYTPKRRRRAGPETTAILPKQEAIEVTESLPSQAHDDKHVNPPGSAVASNSNDRDDSSSSESESFVEEPPQEGRFLTDSKKISATSSLPLIPQKPADASNHLHSYQGQGIIRTSLMIPWTHSTIAPLPNFIVRGLKSMNPTEMPNCAMFNESFRSFLDNAMDEIRETSCLSLDAYTTVSRALSRRDTSHLSPRLREWINLHHLCSGSDRFDLIVMPRESTFQADEASRESYRRAYCAEVDRNSSHEGRRTPDYFGTDRHRFDRLPVREQIFDILTYAHSSHCDSFAMLSTIRNWGFTFVTWPMAELYLRLCPVCSFRTRQTEPSRSA